MQCNEKVKIIKYVCLFFQILEANPRYPDLYNAGNNATTTAKVNPATTAIPAHPANPSQGKSISNLIILG